MCTICPDLALHLFVPEAFVADEFYLHLVLEGSFDVSLF